MNSWKGPGAAAVLLWNAATLFAAPVHCGGDDNATAANHAIAGAKHGLCSSALCVPAILGCACPPELPPLGAPGPRGATGSVAHDTLRLLYGDMASARSPWAPLRGNVRSAAAAGGPGLAPAAAALAGANAWLSPALAPLAGTLSTSGAARDVEVLPVSSWTYPVNGDNRGSWLLAFKEQAKDSWICLVKEEDNGWVEGRAVPPPPPPRTQRAHAISLLPTTSLRRPGVTMAEDRLAPALAIGAPPSAELIPGARTGGSPGTMAVVSEGLPDLPSTPQLVTANDGGVVDFGRVAIGGCAWRAVTVTNVGEAGSQLAGAFPAAEAPFGPDGDESFGPLRQGESATRYYSYSPAKPGTHSRVLTIASNGGTVLLTVVGTAAPDAKATAASPNGPAADLEDPLPPAGRAGGRRAPSVAQGPAPQGLAVSQPLLPLPSADQSVWRSAPIARRTHRRSAAASTRPRRPATAHHSSDGECPDDAAAEEREADGVQAAAAHPPELRAAWELTRSSDLGLTPSLAPMAQLAGSATAPSASLSQSLARDSLAAEVKRDILWSEAIPVTPLVPGANSVDTLSPAVLSSMGLDGWEVSSLRDPKIPELTTIPPNGGTMNFGWVLVTTAAERTLTAANTGGPASRLYGDFPAASNPFSPATTQAFGPLKAQPPETASRIYTYTPAARGAHSLEVTVTSNGGNSTITLWGQGVAPVSSVDTAGTHAGLVRVGATGAASLSVTNIGDGNLSGAGAISNLRGSAPAGTGEFARVGPGTISLQDGASQTINYTYTPATRGADALPLWLNFDNGHPNGTNAPHTVPFTLFGHGVGPVFHSTPQPNSVIDFGWVIEGGFGSQDLDVGNISPDPDGGDPRLTNLTLLSYEFTGPDAGLFALIGFAPGTVITASSPFLDLEILFEAGFILGPKTATLTIITDEGAPFGMPGRSFQWSLTAVTYIPEPSTLTLYVVGGLLLLWRRRSGRHLAAKREVVAGQQNLCL